jgi:hypothetical protein
MTEENPSRKARIVRRACKEMGFHAVWEASQVSESEYVIVWFDIDEYYRSPIRRVRFSDHVLPDQHKGDFGDYPDYNFEVACTIGHEEVDGDCYQAIEWVAKSFERTVPAWVPRKALIAA